MGPLEGVKVLDLSKYGPSRYCSMILGDLGADVIVVEVPTFVSSLPVVSEDSGALYVGHNRGKRSIALNLKKDEGKDILNRLIENIDVLIEANRPGVLKRRGLDFESVNRLNPRIIYCSITGYGQDGPYAQRTGHEINFAGASGIVGLTGSRNGPPVYLQSPSVADLLGGVTQAVIAICAALYSRVTTGKGQHLDVSITDGALFYHWIDGPEYLLTGKRSERSEMLTGSDMACMNIYRAGDGKYFTVGCFEPWLWENFCKLVGREEYVATQFDGFERQKEMYEAFASVFATKDRDEWVRLLDEADVSVAPAYDFDDMFTDPHFRHRKAVVEVDHPKLGRIRLLNTPFKLSGTPAEVRRRPPLWAEHTDEVLSDLLGYSAAELERLREEQVIE